MTEEDSPSCWSKTIAACNARSRRPCTILFMSGVYTSETVKARIEEIGALIHFLEKPFEPSAEVAICRQELGLEDSDASNLLSKALGQILVRERMINLAECEEALRRVQIRAYVYRGRIARALDKTAAAQAEFEKALLCNAACAEALAELRLGTK